MSILSETALHGHHILVTGGGTGLGRAMAEGFARYGAKVSVCGRRPEPLHETVEAIRSAGGEAAAIPCNVRDETSVREAVEAAETALGPLTGLVNNAAANFLAATESLSAGGFDAIVKTNLYGTFFATQAVGQKWIARKQGGVILSIVTTYADTGSAFVVPSAVSKAGVVALTKSLAAEWGSYGIRLNAIAPGPFPTEGAWSRLVPGEAGDRIEAEWKGRIPAGRFGEPSELADVASFLLSDAAAYLTGHILVLDGGEVLTNGGQFNALLRIPRKQLGAMMASMKGGK